jgi:hypothetical protein
MVMSTMTNRRSVAIKTVALLGKEPFNCLAVTIERRSKDDPGRLCIGFAGHVVRLLSIFAVARFWLTAQRNSKVASL